MLIGSSPAYGRRIRAFQQDDPLLIYSMWGGYVKKGADTYKDDLGRVYHSWPENRRIELHTSGHAAAEDLQNMILTVDPQRYILPIHTEKPEGFARLEIGAYRDKICMLDDQGVLEV